MELFDLSGKVAIITGSGQGIGAEAARLFANEGAKGVVADIDESKLRSPLPRPSSSSYPPPPSSSPFPAPFLNLINKPPSPTYTR